MQAMQKDDGSTFTCTQSSAWRKDSRCWEVPSDFMTTGEHFGQLIPVVPKGFVRWVQLSNINAPTKHKDYKKVYYIYCGDANVVPSTAGWAPFGAEMAAAMAGKRGSQRIGCMRAPVTDTTRMSVETCLKKNPLLDSEGVTLDDFNFSQALQQPSSVAAPTAEQPSSVAALPHSLAMEAVAQSVQWLSAATVAPSQAAVPTAEQPSSFAAPTAEQPSSAAAPPQSQSMEAAAQALQWIWQTARSVQVVQPRPKTIKRFHFWQPCAACKRMRNVPRSVHDEVRHPNHLLFPPRNGRTPSEAEPWKSCSCTRRFASAFCLTHIGAGGAQILAPGGTKSWTCDMASAWRDVSPLLLSFECCVQF